MEAQKMIQKMSPKTIAKRQEIHSEIVTVLASLARLKKMLTKKEYKGISDNLNSLAANAMYSVAHIEMQAMAKLGVL